MSTFKLPDLGEGLPDAEIVEWHVAEGDVVKTDQPMVSMETAKAVVDVPVPFDGTVTTLHGAAGDIIETGAALITITAAGETAEDQAQSTSADAVAQDEGDSTTDQPDAARSDSGTVVGAMESSDAVIASAHTVGNVKVTPAVRALARKLKVDLTQVTPTGAGDVVTARDVKQAAEHGTAQISESSSTPSTPAPSQPATPARAEPAAAPTPASGEWTAIKGPRRSMARAMADAHATVVPTTITEDINCGLWQGKQDVTVRMIRAMNAGVQREPVLNSWFNADGPKIQTHKAVHLGIAVDTQDGLFVSKLADTDSKSAAQIRDDINRLRQNVENRSIPPQDLTGYTIMLSNVGVYAGKYTSPVITPPCVAIMATGKMRTEVVALNGGFGTANVMPVSLTFDHRAVTGGEAARFLAAFRDDLSLPN